MDRTTPPGVALRFGDCRVDPTTRTLRRGGRVVPLQPLPFDLLLYLIENRDRVVTQAEISRDVWGGVHVNDQSRRYALHAVRRAIGDRGDRQRLIRTYPRKGLRFVGPVEDAVPKAPSFAEGVFGRSGPEREFERGLASVAAGGVGRTYLVGGEAGIGKTTVLAQAARSARERGFLVAEVRCDGGRDGPAYWPWTRALRMLIRDVAPELDLAAVIARSPEVGWALPELVRGEKPHGRPHADASSARHRLFDGVGLLVSAVARSRPIAICMDDLHEADDDTLRLACHLAPLSARASVALFFAHRDPCEPASANLPERIAKLSAVAGVTSLRLAGLAAEDFRGLIRDRFGVETSEGALADLHERTAGNPFFLMQLLSVLRQEDRLLELESPGAPEVTISRHVQGAIVRQTDALPARTRRLLETACVVGLEFSESLLCAATGLSAGVVQRALDASEAQGVLSAAASPGVRRFVHPLVRECLYAGLPPARRRGTHLRVAVSMEALAGERGAKSLALARHFAAAAPHPAAARGVEHFIAAAETDVERAAFEAARASLDAAFRLAESLCLGDPLLRCRLWLRVGVVEGLLLHRGASRAALEKAAEHALALGRGDLVCEAALAFSPELLAIETGVCDAALVRLLRRAAEAVGGERSALRARVLARLAVALHWSVDAAEIPALVEEATEIAGEVGDPEVARFVETAGQMALYAPGAGAERDPPLEPPIEGDASAALLGRILRITRLIEAADLVAAEAEIDRFGEIVEERGVRSAHWYPEMFRSTIALLRGRYAEVERHCASYSKQGVRVDDRNVFHSLALQRTMVAIEVGPLEGFDAAVAKMAASFPAVEGWEAGLCLVQAELGLLPEANERLDRLIEGRVLDCVPRNSWLGTIGCLALAIQELGRGDLAPKLYDAWRPFAGRLVVVGFGSLCWGAADRFLGVLAGMAREQRVAAAHFDAAIALNDRCGALPALAHTWRDRGRMAAREGIAGEGSLQRAAGLARSLGMTRLETRVAGDLQR